VTKTTLAKYLSDNTDQIVLKYSSAQNLGSKYINMMMMMMMMMMKFASQIDANSSAQHT
jgi:hypothetical protein